MHGPWLVFLSFLFYPRFFFFFFAAPKSWIHLPNPVDPLSISLSLSMRKNYGENEKEKMKGEMINILVHKKETGREKKRIIEKRHPNNLD